MPPRVRLSNPPLKTIEADLQDEDEEPALQNRRGFPPKSVGPVYKYRGVCIRDIKRCRIGILADIASRRSFFNEKRVLSDFKEQRGVGDES